MWPSSTLLFRVECQHIKFKTLNVWDWLYRETLKWQRCMKNETGRVKKQNKNKKPLQGKLICFAPPKQSTNCDYSELQLITWFQSCFSQGGDKMLSIGSLAGMMSKEIFSYMTKEVMLSRTLICLCAVFTLFWEGISVHGEKPHHKCTRPKIQNGWNRKHGAIIKQVLQPINKWINSNGTYFLDTLLSYAAFTTTFLTDLAAQVKCHS